MSLCWGQYMTSTSKTTNRGKCFFLPLIVNSVNLQNLINLINSSSSTVHSWCCFPAGCCHPTHLKGHHCQCFSDIEGGVTMDRLAVVTDPVWERMGWMLAKVKHLSVAEFLLNLQNSQKPHTKSDSHHFYIHSAYSQKTAEGNTVSRCVTVCRLMPLQLL